MSLQIFVSSTCYELRDLRAAIKDFLEDRDMEPMLSNENGFPDHAGFKPYVSCLKVLEDCLMVIGVIDRRYGETFTDWEPYPQYKDLSPIHAELRHALITKKRLFLYVHQSTMAVYELWRKDSIFDPNKLPKGMDIKIFPLIAELRKSNPAPWIEEFKDVSSILESLKKKLTHEIYQRLIEQKKQNENEVRYFVDKLLDLPPDIRRKVGEGINPDLIERVSNLESQLFTLEEKYRQEGAASQESTQSLTLAIRRTEQELIAAKRVLFLAATKDVSWLSLVRTRLMPKQPGRVPFHNDAEVAIRGYHCSNMRDVAPKLSRVTWSYVPYAENNLHRGYIAALIFDGHEFAPGIVWTTRSKGDTSPPAGQTDYFWHPPNIYFGDYLEVSTNSDPVEAPLGYRGVEFCVRNPNGKRSEWVEFSYEFDFEMLNKIMNENAEQGKVFLKQQKYKEAIEPLRKALTFSCRINGDSAPFTKEIRKLHETALDEAVLVTLRFGTGAKVRVVSGTYKGKQGVIESIKTRHANPYYVKEDSSGEYFQVGDSEVEPI